MNDPTLATDRENMSILNGDGAARPLVTFALFVYNQERYIREAVASALAQQYTPLEIIVSDDGSSDQAVAIIQEMAAAYTGPHALIVRQNPQNLGLINHVNAVFGLAKGDIIVLAAGDDVSLPSRVQTIVDAALRHPHAMLFHSCAVQIDATGREIGTARPSPAVLSGDVEAMALSSGLHLGATAAINRRLIDLFDPISHTGTYEDLTLGFRAGLWEGLHFIDQELVRYRYDTGHSSKTDYFAQDRTERLRYFRLAVATYQQRLEDLSQFEQASGRRSPRLRLRLERQLCFTVGRIALRERPGQFLVSTLLRNPFIGIRAVLSEMRYGFQSRRLARTRPTA